MDTNKRKTGLARLIEIAGTKRRLLIGAMLLAVITAIVQFVPIIAVYNILIELAEHALDPSLIDKAYSFLRFRSAHVCFPHALAHCRFQHSV